MITITDTLLFLLFTLSCSYFWFNYQYSYWKRKNIPFIKPNLLFGNLKDMIFGKKCSAHLFSELYNKDESINQPIVGIYVFHKPALLIREPELIKRILVKDFNKFSNRYSKAKPDVDPLGSYNLFFLKNPSWKLMRSKLSPVFTGAKLKQMLPLINDVGKKLGEHLSKLTSTSNKKSMSIEVKDKSALYTTDSIASIAFGLNANSLENPNNEFRQNGRELFKFTFLRSLEFTAVFFIPQLVSFLRTKTFTEKAENFLRSTVNFVIKERESSNSQRNDLIDTLITLKNSSIASKEKTDEVPFKGDVLIAQAAVFFTAGFETTSSAMAFAIYELCKNQEIQKRLRDEIKTTLENNNGELSHDVIQNMEYLDQVIKEVLRLYPPLPFLDRECTLTNEDEDDYSLEPYSNFKIPEGMPVYIPMLAIHKDPKYFPNPDEFDPNRFSPENKKNINPYTYMPFGIGPRSCIGERLGVLETKIGLINFFKNHSVKPSEKTPKTIQFDKKALILQSEGGIHINILQDPLFK